MLAKARQIWYNAVLQQRRKGGIAMGRTIVVAEKPSVGRDIARVLGCNQRGQGCLIGQDYTVTWAVGHLVKVTHIFPLSSGVSPST